MAVLMSARHVVPLPASIVLESEVIRGYGRGSKELGIPTGTLLTFPGNIPLGPPRCLPLLGVLWGHRLVLLRWCVLLL